MYNLVSDYKLYILDFQYDNCIKWEGNGNCFYHRGREKIQFNK